MLAKPDEPFDSDNYLFEVKSDGTRTLAFIERNGFRRVHWRRVDMTHPYPEFEFLGTLPVGTVLAMSTKNERLRRLSACA
jgi:ATP-dependent DNA ligase